MVYIQKILQIDIPKSIIFHFFFSKCKNNCHDRSRKMEKIKRWGWTFSLSSINYLIYCFNLLLLIWNIGILYYEKWMGQFINPYILYFFMASFMYSSLYSYFSYNYCNSLCHNVWWSIDMINIDRQLIPSFWSHEIT